MQFKSLKYLNGINTIKPLLRLTFLVAFFIFRLFIGFSYWLKWFYYIIMSTRKNLKSINNNYEVEEKGRTYQLIKV